MKQEYKCDWCGKAFYRYPCQAAGKNHLFCSRKCLADFSSKEKNPDGYMTLKDLAPVSEHMSAMNQEMNQTRMTVQTRQKLREAHLDTGEGRCYAKYYGKLAHRVAAEKKLGRPLKAGEVVHHLDFNPRNSAPDNLMVFPSNSAHTRYHAKLRKFFNTGVIDDWAVEEVMPDEVHTT